MGDFHICYLLKSGNSACYGRNEYTQSVPYNRSNAIGLAAGDLNTCYILNNGNSACTGSNMYNQSFNYTLAGKGQEKPVPAQPNATNTTVKPNRTQQGQPTQTSGTESQPLFGIGIWIIAAAAAVIIAVAIIAILVLGRKGPPKPV
jgi:hypothetical protein